MISDILIIGGGAAGLMAAYGAGSALFRAGKTAQVTVLEKMPRPGRKIMITGKGRCNFTNVKAWNDFSRHIRTNPNVLRPAFYNLTPQALISLFAANGLRAVVERGDRAFPASYQASDVVDTLVRMAGKVGANLVNDAAVESITYQENKELYHVTCRNGKEYTARVLILATGGLSYPSTGSTGDGYAWAEALGHTLTERFPSLTALVPEGYKNAQTAGTDGPKHIDRAVPMEKMGKYLCGNKLKNCGLRLVIDGNTSEEEFGDVEFTDGGIEGPVVFQVSRKAVKALRNGSKVSLELDLKAGVRASELSARLTELWKAIRSDERSRGRSEKNLLTVLLGKLLPWDLVDGFLFCHPEILPARKGRNGRFFEVDLAALAIALQRWKMDIAGYVGYERCVVTAGGVAMSEIDPKTLSSKKRENLFFCGELLDMDADTGGYNLHLAFCTGYLAGQHAAERV